MAKIIDITEKLNFNENPKLKIKDTELEVNSDATTMLKVMGVVGDGKDITPQKVNTMYELLFCESERAKIEALKLNITDFNTLVDAAASAAAGGQEQGE